MLFSDDQLKATKQLREFILYNTEDKTILLQGSAGTGKTSIVNHLFSLPEFSKFNVCLTATTNKAVSVMEQMHIKSNDKKSVKSISFATLHKLLKTKRVIDNFGDPQFVVNKNNIFSKGRNKKKSTNINSYDIIVIDEVSMLSSSLFNSLMEIIDKVRGKIIFTGDKFQLNPVNEEESEVFSIPNKVILTTIHRAKNGILGISNHIRESVEHQSKVKIRKWTDENVMLIKKSDEWINKYIEFLSNSKDPSTFPIILAYTNQRCLELNTIIRKILFKEVPNFTNSIYLPKEHIVFNNAYKHKDSQKVFHTSTQEVIYSMDTSVKTTSFLTINDLISKPVSEAEISSASDTCKVCRTETIDEDLPSSCEHKFCTTCYNSWIKLNKCCPFCTISCKDGIFNIKKRTKLTHLINKFATICCSSYKTYLLKLSQDELIETLHEKSREKYNIDLKKLKDILADIKSLDNSNLTFCILSNLWEFLYANFIDVFADISYGYCITSHKSQGSTYHTAFVDVGNILNFNRSVVDGLKCLYTSVTRPSNNLCIHY